MVKVGFLGPHGTFAEEAHRRCDSPREATFLCVLVRIAAAILAVLLLWAFAK